MSNMSYCRFANTKDDLKDCIKALEQRNIESDDEKRAARVMIEDLLQWCIDENIIEDYDADKIIDVINECGTEKLEDDE